jgi:hypothetical protein
MASVNLTSDFPFTGNNPQQLSGAVVIKVRGDGSLIFRLFSGSAFDKRQIPCAALQNG